MDWSQKYSGAALITGASSGLGAGFAREIAACGVDVVLVARRGDRLEALANEIRAAHGVNAHVIVQDLCEIDAAERVKAAVDALGVEVGLLVNNAGIGSHGRFQDSNLAVELRIIDLNCRAYVAMSACFLPGMIARGNGGIIHVASTAAFAPVKRFATYGATKAFELSFGQAMAEDLEGTGVDVLTYCPGYIRSEFHQNAEVNDLPQGILWNEPGDAARAALNALGRRRLEVFKATSGALQAGRKMITRQILHRLARKLTPVYRLLPIVLAGGLHEFIAQVVR